jgi:hypothetical protein
MFRAFLAHHQEALHKQQLVYCLLKLVDTLKVPMYIRAGRSRDRILVGARFFAHVQTGPGAQPPPVQWVPGLSRG